MPRWPEWLPLTVGLVAMYAPTYLALARGAWTTEDQVHGPIVLAVALWVAWTRRASLGRLAQTPSPIIGAAVLLIGVCTYILGRSQDIALLDVGSQIPVLVGLVLCVLGWRGLRLLWFPIFFLMFLIPVPTALVDAVTAPLKQYVSVITEHILYFAGYPIARDGVTLMIGPYQLLVADACSGLHSMYSLAAVGLLYVYLVKPPGWWRKLLLIASMIPIAFVANLLRVIALVLITYYFGDAAGQGFMHGLAGMLLFVFALASVISLDWLVGLVCRSPVTRDA